MAVRPVERGRHRYRRPRRPRRSGRRLVPVLLNLLLAVVICAVGFRYGAGFLQVHEARWVANVLEQATERRIIRPAARYVGPPAPQPVPA